MSQIFDALRRSEAERSGVEVSKLSGPTELLQRAERQAVVKWEAEVVSERQEAKEAARPDASLEPSTGISVTTEENVPVPVVPLQTEVRQAPFKQIQSIRVTSPAQSRLVCFTDGGSPAAEAFRLLGVRLQDLRQDRPLKRVLITSTIPQEGKSTVSANLACTLAQRTGERVLLLEGDLRRPSLSQLFGIGKNPGICEQLKGERSLVTSIYRLEGPDLWIMPAGIAPSHPLELLQSAALPGLLDQLSAWFDWLIIDSPPLLPLADTSIWARLADGILLVTRQGTTRKRQLTRGLEALEPGKIIGALMNCSKTMDDSGYYYAPPTTSRSKNMVNI
jgi:capsular exopolysaccharide synthesis family protein